MATVECTWSGRLDGGLGRHIVGSPAVSDRPTAVSPCCCCSDCWRTWRWSARTSPSEWYRLILGSPSRPRPAGRTLWNRPLSTILSVIGSSYSTGPSSSLWNFVGRIYRATKRQHCQIPRWLLSDYACDSCRCRLQAKLFFQWSKMFRLNRKRLVVFFFNIRMYYIGFESERKWYNIAAHQSLAMRVGDFIIQGRLSRKTLMNLD